MPDFQYIPLPPAAFPNGHRIRIVELMPRGNPEAADTIEARLVDELLDSSDNLPFEALSYCWGDPKLTCTIRLNNELFHVTANVHIALRRLRLASGARRLWIDAICVDQNDLDERNSQVLLMRGVYGKASTVLVWLGELPENGALGIKLLHTMDKILRSGEKFDPKASFENSARWIERGLPGGNVRKSDHWSGLQAILTCPWFGRMWVIQEVAVARRVSIMCGAETLDWDDNIELIELAHQSLMVGRRSISGLDTSTFLQMALLRNKYITGQEKWSFARLLTSFQTQLATDRLDHVFSLIGLCKPTHSVHLIPNYRFSHTKPRQYRTIYLMAHESQKDLQS